MLDQETKKRIFDARDILVGKIPDPKAQVEQITTALIYKFMADMDYESEELGGEPQFFTGEYKKYAWSNLVDTRLGGEERFNLYVEALNNMPQNPALPLLFRNMLKNAFLPYRDPETLRLFLKKINEFTYDHSEKLGDAFEYLLSVLGSQGDAGQFRTPRHIIDFIVAVLDPKKDETILDPACGTAGFLISSYKHILRQNGIKTPGDKLTPDEKTKLMNNFIGYDISPDMVRLSLVNMYLHNFPNPITYEYDTLTSEERWDETADVIMANPPFMSPTGGIRPHKRFSIQAKRSEILFVDYIAEHLNINGRAGVIVPEGIIFQSSTAYKALRKMLVEKYLYAVVSLPAGVFQPYSGVKTTILLMDKSLAKKTKNILFVKIESDGLDLGAQRRPIDKNDLPYARNIIQRYTQALREGIDPRELLHIEETTDIAIIVKKAKIAEKGDYGLTGSRYKPINTSTNYTWPMVEIGSVCNLINGRAFKPSDWEKEESGGLPIIRIQNLNDSKADFNYYTGQVEEKLIINTGDLLFSWSGSKGTSFGPHIWSKGKGILNQHIFKVEHSSKVLRSFFYLMLKRAVNEVEEIVHGGVGLVHITKGDLESIKIPLPPLEIQKEVVDEVDYYRKIIEGARQVVTSYKPSFTIKSNWQTVKLGDICEFRNGLNYTKESSGEKIKILGVKDFQDNFYLDASSLDYITADGKLKENDLLKEGDIVFVRSNGNQNLIGRCLLIGKIDERIAHSGFTIRLTLNSRKVSPIFLAYLLKMDITRKKMAEGGTGANIQSLNQGVLSNLTIPIPPLEVQEQIVLQIDEEQKLVAANKKLVDLFEQKIKAKIAEVWDYGDVTLENATEVENNYIEAPEDIEIEEPEIKQEALFTLF